MKPVGRVFLWLGVAIGIALVAALAVRRFRQATFYPGMVDPPLLNAPWRE